MINKNLESSFHLKEVIEKAIEDHIITHEEYDEIIQTASKDGVLDQHEMALLSELQHMIQDGMVKFRKS